MTAAGEHPAIQRGTGIPRDWRDRAQTHGALLFTSTGFSSTDEFDEFIRAFGVENFPYQKSLSNAVRVNRTPRVFSANEAPADVSIELHHELAQTPMFPRYLFFFCEVAPENGGATPLCRSDVLLSRLRKELPEFVAKCEEAGLCYSNVMAGEADLASGMGRSWQNMLQAETKAAAERRLRDLGYAWEWEGEDALRMTTPPLPAIRGLSDGRTTFFNQLIAAAHWSDERNDPHRALCFGDGSAMDFGAVRLAREIAEQMTVDVAWNVGDVALVDNFVTMHGRRRFRGSRKVWASLANPHTHAA